MLVLTGNYKIGGAAGANQRLRCYWLLLSLVERPLEDTLK